MAVETLGVFLGLILTIFHFAWESMAHHLHKYRRSILSFGFGVTAAYIFLQLLPDLYLGISSLNNGLFVLVLVGFALMHLVELYSFKSTEKERKKRKSEIATEHSIAFFIYHFFLGIVFVTLLKRDIAEGIFFFVPLLLYVVVSSLSLAEIHEAISRKTINKIILASSSFLGALAGTYFLNLTEKSFFGLLAFVTGTVLYAMIKDSLPKEENESSLFFISGVVFYWATIMLYWNMGVII